MRSDRKPQSLQELIDSYNEEIMRYSQRAAQGAADERTAGEQERETGEEEAERGRTERDYWLGSGKQGLQGGRASTLPRPEPTEPLYPPGSHMPRPEPEEPLVPPDEPSDWREEVTKSLQQLWQRIEELSAGVSTAGNGQQTTDNGTAHHSDGGFLPPYRTAAPPAAKNLPDMAGKAPLRKNDSAAWGIKAPPAGGGRTPEMRAADAAQPMPEERMRQQRQAAPAVPIAPEGRRAQSEQSIAADRAGAGWLQVGVYTARQATPVPNATVTVYRETDAVSELYASALTDDDGKIPIVRLPAGASSTDEINAPFEVYTVSVTADGYIPRKELSAQIFDGITALLWVELTPLPDSAWPPAGNVGL